MKKILSFTLLLGVLCLAGCKEDSQNVEFTVKEFRINQKAQTFDVSIIADCQWVIEDSDGFLSASITFGEGNSIITVTAWRNETFDERKNTLVIRSEDGSSWIILPYIKNPISARCWKSQNLLTPKVVLSK